LRDVVPSGGAVMSALSGHDYVTVVPEPASLAFWLAGLAALAWRRRGQASRCCLADGARR